MATTNAAAATTPATTATTSPAAAALREMELLHAEFPERPGLIRRVHRLWAGAYRVNYHEDDGDHCVRESWFVTVENGNVRRQNN